MKINRRPDRTLPRALAIIGMLCLCDCSAEKDQKETERYILEQLRVLWRLCCDRRWISQSQLLFVVGRIDEIGKMAGGWSKQIQASSGG